MASEILAVPESRLAEVIAVLRSGLKVVTVSAITKEALITWCDEEDEYLKRMSEGTE